MLNTKMLKTINTLVEDNRESITEMYTVMSQRSERQISLTTTITFKDRAAADCFEELLDTHEAHT